MTVKMSAALSDRGFYNVHKALPRIPKTSLEASSNADLIDLSLAENTVNRNEVLDILRASLGNEIQSQVPRIAPFSREILRLID
jgi:hypothetical protein